MLSPDRLVPFLLAVALVELTPGPNMGYLALVASRHGRAAGFVTVAGVTVGLAAYLVATVLGLADLVQRWPALYAILHWAGVVYLFWLAIDAWRGADSAGPAPTVADGRRLFARGLTSNLLNPKAALFYVALLPGFIDPRGSAVRQALVLGGLHLTVAVAVHCGVVLAAAGARPMLRRWQGGRPDVVQRGMALGLGAIALWLAVSAPGR